MAGAAGDIGGAVTGLPELGGPALSCELHEVATATAIPAAITARGIAPATRR
jgi:hypothetical protein